MENQDPQVNQAQYGNQDPPYKVQEQYGFKNTSVVSTGDWILTMVIMALPIVNFIMLLVWAFSGGTPESKANWAKASLIVMLISIVLLFLFWGAIGAAFLGAMKY